MLENSLEIEKFPKMFPNRLNFFSQLPVKFNLLGFDTERNKFKLLNEFHKKYLKTKFL